ncbi:MAG: AbrB/MazE/SpoVT family DNA-binding domain-containing protein [Pseudomonadota bacterium]
MVTATVTSKGQITLPASIRASLGLETGCRIEFVEIMPGQFAIVPATSPVSALKGLLRKPAEPVTIEDMNFAIAAQGMKAR